MRKIYVVDDEHMIADTLTSILQNHGYDATAFYCAEGALAACGLCTPDCIISDVVMPGMSGVEFAMLVRQCHPACRVILFSGNAGTFDMVETARMNGQDFELLLKPVHPRDLLDRLRTSNGHRNLVVMSSSANRQSL